MNLQWKHKGAALLAALTLTMTASLPAAAADNGVGTVTEKDSSTPAPGVTVRSLQAVDGSRSQNIHTLSFRVPGSDYMVLPYYGDNLLSRHTLTGMAAHAQKHGYQVVGGINGDFFNIDGTVTGMPVGAVIQNGRVVCSEDKYPNITKDKEPAWRTMGFKRDGSAVIGRMTLNKSLVLVDEDGSVQRMAFALFNRKMTGSGVHVYTSDFGDTVGNSRGALAVTVSIRQGSFRLDETTVCRVTGIAEDVKNVPIPKDGAVLTIYGGALNEKTEKQLKALKKGQRVDLKLSGGNLWRGTFHAISGPDAVLTGGAVTSAPFIKDRNYPSTLVGVKKDGTVVMAQVDGRNVGGSYGLSAQQAGQYMKSLGCTDALLFDGGGSSEMIAGKSGHMEILNHPSDGNERRLGTCLLVVKKTQEFKNPKPVKPAPPYVGGDATQDSGHQKPTAPPNQPHRPDKPNGGGVTQRPHNGGTGTASALPTGGTAPAGESTSQNMPTDGKTSAVAGESTATETTAAAAASQPEKNTSYGWIWGSVAAAIVLIGGAAAGTWIYIKRKKK